MSDSNITVENIPTDYGRVTKIYITKVICGQYYYAKNTIDGIEWIRQIHKNEVEPFFSCRASIASKIAKVIENP